MRGALGAFLQGAGAVFGALAFLRSQRALWALCAAPMATTLLLFGVATWVFFGLALDPLREGLGEWLAVPEPAAWYAWLWIGPLHLLSALAQLALGVLAFGLTVLVCVAVGGVVASPLLDLLSRRVEQLDAGRVVEVAGGWRVALFTMAQEARRVLFLLGGGLLVAGLGLVPGGQLPAALAGALFGAFFLPLEYTGFLLDRRGIGFRGRRRWLWAHRWHMLGFASMALATFAVPLLNFLCLPLLVTAGTRLSLSLGPPEAEPSA